MSYDQKRLFDVILLSLSERPLCLLGDLSRELCISKGSIAKAVHTATGKTFRHLREEILLEQVRVLLAAQPTCTIKELAFGLGYKSPRSFARAIRRVSGTSPEELRASRVISSSRRDSLGATPNHVTVNRDQA
jgi:AraC-like DNA-binding protein